MPVMNGNNSIIAQWRLDAKPAALLYYVLHLKGVNQWPVAHLRN